jgi:hypothetical protein
MGIDGRRFIRRIFLRHMVPICRGQEQQQYARPASRIYGQKNERYGFTEFEKVAGQKETAHTYPQKREKRGLNPRRYSPGINMSASGA